MGPKGTKKKAAAAAAPAEPAAAAAADFSLRASDAGRGYLLELENALATINGFHSMVGEEPRTGSAAETGFTVLDNESYQRGIASGSYTAGGNLLWLDLHWPSTGVPLRLHVAKYLSNTAFAEPRPYPGALHVAVAQGYSPLNHRGWLHGVSPEEISHAMIFAVAGAARSDAGNTQLLSAWKQCLLSTAFTSRCWALQRNACGMPYKSVRFAWQRIIRASSGAMRWPGFGNCSPRQRVRMRLRSWSMVQTRRILRCFRIS